MDRPVDPKKTENESPLDLESLRKIALEILYPSVQFEHRRPTDPSVQQVRAQQFTQLGEIIQTEFKPPVVARNPAPETIIPKPSPERSATMMSRSSPTSVKYETSRREYRGALDDQNLIQALIEYNKTRRLRGGSISSNHVVVQKENPAPAPVAQEPEFTWVEVPEIQVVHKPVSASQKATGMAAPVLRSRRD